MALMEEWGELRLLEVGRRGLELHVSEVGRSRTAQQQATLLVAREPASENRERQERNLRSFRFAARDSFLEARQKVCIWAIKSFGSNRAQSSAQTLQYFFP